MQKMESRIFKSVQTDTRNSINKLEGLGMGNDGTKR